MILGLTGSIGMGKSTVAAMLRRVGVPVFDADAAVRRLQGPDGSLLGPIEAAFPGTTGVQGVDRAALGRAVFGDRAALGRLERIVHPAVGRMRVDFMRRHRAHRLVVDDVPLLYETHGERRVDGVIVVSAPLWMQWRRVMARPGMTAARLAQIRRLQLADPIKRARADIVIGTGTTRIATARQVRGLVACLRAHGLRYCGHARDRLRHRDHGAEPRRRPPPGRDRLCRAAPSRRDRAHLPRLFPSPARHADRGRARPRPVDRVPLGQAALCRRR